MRREGRIQGSGAGPKVLMVVNAEWAFCTHRLPLAKAILACGLDLTVAAPVEKGMDAVIRAEGIRFVPLGLQRRSRNPLTQILNVAELVRLYRRLRPDRVHHVAIKPVLYGSLAARVARVPAVVNAVTGLGYTFLAQGLKGRLVRASVMRAYRIFTTSGAVPADRVALIPGVGVDLSRFAPAPEAPGPPAVLFGARLLWDKGIGELAEAARLLKKEGIAFRALIAGARDPANPKSVATEDIERWRAEGGLEFLGHRDDMPQLMRECAIVVLPTYREGLPLFLLEAMASSRPIVATDVPGCREVVRPGVNGLLVPTRDGAALAEALKTLLLDPQLRARMGAEGRRIAETEFSQERCARDTLAVYRSLLGPAWPA